jgi:hypothetical protein
MRECHMYLANAVPSHREDLRLFGDFKNYRDDIFTLEERKPTGGRTNVALYEIGAGKKSVG